MSRRGHNPLDDAEALLEGYGVPYKRRPSFRRQIEDLILGVEGTLHIDGTDASLPNAGVHDLLRLMRRRETFRREYGAARLLLSGDPREADADRRVLERRVERALGARRRAERERDEALAERDEALAEREEALEELSKAKRRLSEKSAQCDALLFELYER